MEADAYEAFFVTDSDTDDNSDTDNSSDISYNSDINNDFENYD